jgi:ankyrin repeat protein
VFITKKHLSRRTVLRGIGVTVALPLLDSMVPAQTPVAKTAAAPRTRFAAIEMVHGAAGSTIEGAAKALLKAGAEANAAPEDGSTPLMLAPASGNADAVKVLLDHGAEVNAAENAHGQTALMFAAAKGRAAVIRLLVARGADTKAVTKVIKLERPRVDEDGNPLPAAAPEGRKRLEFLGGQARGASATVMGGMTALLLASRDGRLDAAKALVETGADINQVSAGDKSSPIVVAICNGHYDLARFLLDHGADPNLATIDGLAALYAVEDTEYAQVGWAPNPITTEEKVSHLELMKALVAHGAIPNARLNKALWFRPTSHNQEWIDKKGATTFWRAAQSRDVAAMRLLVAAGADPNTPSEDGATPLMAAAGLGWGANASRNVPGAWLDAVRYCLELGADVNANDKYGYTALHGAAYRGDNEMVKLFVEKGARLDVKSKRGQTVTDMANGPMVNAHLPMEHPDTVALLEKLGAPPPAVPVAGAPKTTR